MAGRTRKNVLANIFLLLFGGRTFFALSLFLFNNSESEITFPSQDLTGIGSKKKNLQRTLKKPTEVVSWLKINWEGYSVAPML